MKKIIFIFIITIMFQASYKAKYDTTHGQYITYQDLKEIELYENKTDVNLNLGRPSFIIKTKEKEFWIYYYQKKTYKERTITRYITITFNRKNNEIIDYSIFY